MKKTLSSFEVACVVEELQVLVGGILDSFTMPDKKELFLGVHKGGKAYIRLVAGKVLYLTHEKKLAERPSGFCSFLRKHLDQARLIKVVQASGERVVSFCCEARAGAFELVVELYGKGNILLLQDGCILGCAETKTWKDRVIAAGEKYAVTAKAGLDWEQVCTCSAHDSLVKALAADGGLGGLYAEELCLRAQVSKNLSPKEISPVQCRKLKDVWMRMVDEKKAGYCIFKEGALIDVTPLRLLQHDGLDVQEFPLFSDALAFAWAQEEEAADVADVRRRIEKLATIIVEQQKNIASWEKEREEALQTAEYIYHHYTEVHALLEAARAAFESKKPMPAAVKDVKQKEKKIVVELSP
ncbi:NFACT family protein [Candidatus Woesearchaeota archaeon]|nr:NFACT family protein [Candidatus Woesearchaeota archaeon]